MLRPVIALVSILLLFTVHLIPLRLSAAQSPDASAAPDEGLANFSSNLPLVIINTSGQEIPHETKVPASVRVIDSKNSRATVMGAADFDGRALINIRGHTSLRYPKRSYTLTTVDSAEDPRNVSLLGLPKDSDWVLYGPYPDKTLMRDVLAYELHGKIRQ